MIVLIFWAQGAPSYRIRMGSVTTYCQAGYLLSRRLSSAVRDAPKRRIHAPKSFRIHAPNIRILFEGVY